MKTSTLPAVRVTPEVRALAESVLRKGETLSMFIEESLKQKAQWRKDDAEFYTRGLAASAKVRAGGRTYTTEEVMSGLRAILESKRKATSTKAAKAA